MILRTTRALAWLRWRLLLGSVRAAARRDAWERLSAVAQVAVPAVLGLFLLGLTALFTVASFMGGRLVAGGDRTGLALLLLGRLVLLVALLAVVLSPLLSSGTGIQLSRGRLALLPVSRGALHAAEVVSVLGEPWVVLILPALAAAFPAGLAAGGALGAAGVALVAGLAMLAVLASLGAAVSFAFEAILRDRRRGEIARLVVLLVVMVASFVPALLSLDVLQSVPEGRAPAARGRDAPLQLDLPVAAMLLPSELYGHAVTEAVLGRPAQAVLPLLGLWGAGAALFLASGLLHGRLAASPVGGERGHRAATDLRLPALRFPGLRPAVAAVAWAQALVVLRTIRGRFIVFASPISIVAVGVVLSRLPGYVLPPAVVTFDGASLAAASTALCLVGFAPISMNLFAVSGRGLQLELLAPVSDAELVRGKTVGVALLFAVSATCGVLLCAGVMPSGSPLRWLAVVLGGAAAFVLLAPVAALTSAVFPRPVDLGGIGREGQPHALAAVIGVVAGVVAVGVPGLLGFVGSGLLGSDLIAVGLLLGWLASCLLPCRFLLGGVASIVGARRENLALVARQR
jgi:hypothetical protein